MNTYGCDLYGCMYNSDGTCCYHTATIKQEVSRACHKDIMESLVELRHDYEELSVGEGV